MAKETIKIHSAYDRPKSNGIVCGPGKTEQAHKKQTDINYILEDYRRSGLIKHAAKNKGVYDDVPAVDFQEAMLLVTNAQNMFMELPSDMRKRFGNDPGAFLNFVQDPGNKQEMARMGILQGNDGLDLRGAAVGSPVADSLIDTDADGRPDTHPDGVGEGGK